MENEPLLSDEAKALMRKAAAIAVENYRGFDMALWIVDFNDFVLNTLPHPVAELERSPMCGTVGCYGFEICIAAGDTIAQIYAMDSDPDINNGVAERAAKHLGLTTSDCYMLFHVFDWPTEYRRAYTEARQLTKDRALVLQEVVELWIKGDGHFPD